MWASGLGEHALSFDEQRLRQIEHFLFTSDAVDEICTTGQCGLRNVLELENAGGFRDVGHEMYQLLRTSDVLHAMRNYQNYWDEMQAKMLLLSSLNTTVSRIRTGCLDFFLRLNFSEAHAEFLFALLSRALAEQRGHARVHQDAARAIGRQQFTAINERVRLFLGGILVEDIRDFKILLKAFKLIQSTMCGECSALKIILSDKDTRRFPL